jgi:FkbM family methyltransferase
MKNWLKRTIASLAPTASQAGQDQWIFGEVFNGMKNGCFVELGSHDGVTHSNTYKLERNFQWRGICVEANPVTFRLLKINRLSKCVNVCLSDKTEKVRFTLAGEFGQIVPGSQINPPKSDDVLLDAMPLLDVLARENCPPNIDYLSVDLEGSEDRVLKHFDFDHYCFKTITIERPSPFLRELLARKGYILIKDIPCLDAFYVHESHMKSYTKVMFEHWETKTWWPLIRSLIRGQ